MTEPHPMAGYDTEAHTTAQANCHHVIYCAVDASTRATVTRDLANASRTGDQHTIAILQARLQGPCCLPQVRTDQPPAGCRNRPIDVTVHTAGTDLASTTGEIHISPADENSWLRRVTLDATTRRLTVVVQPTDPVAPITTLTVNPDGSIHLTT